MLVTNRTALLFRRHVVEERLSPYDAVCRMRKEMPGQAIPCLSTWYRHVNAGDVGVRHGETPCHPKRRPKGPRPHPARTVPGRLTLDDRPAGATNRSRFGHYEMDTVVSSANGRGGLLVLVDRRSRRYAVELLEHVAQDDVVAALRRMTARKALGNVLSITTDNGCEFLDPGKIKAVVGCDACYTRAYASWEKGSARELQPVRPQMAPEGDGLLEVHARGHAQARACHQLDPPQTARRKDRVRIRHGPCQGRMKETINESVRTAAEAARRGLQKIDPLDLQFTSRRRHSEAWEAGRAARARRTWRLTARPATGRMVSFPVPSPSFPPIYHAHSHR